jgi:hypothetical protein
MDLILKIWSWEARECVNRSSLKSGKEEKMRIWKNEESDRKSQEKLRAEKTVGRTNRRKMGRYGK